MTKEYHKSIELIRQFYSQKKAIFFIPTKFISYESASLGFLLDYIIKNKINPGCKFNFSSYRSFFSNSLSEGIQTSIKIVKHFMHYNNSSARKFLIYSNDAQINHIFSCKKYSPRIFPGLEIHSSQDKLLKKADHYNLILIDEKLVKNIDFCALSKIVNRAKNLFLFIFMRGSNFKIFDVIKSILKKTNLYIDGIIFGNELTYKEIPFGVTTFSSMLFTPWLKLDNCFIHSSTYGGNSLALQAAINFIISSQIFNSKELKVIQETLNKIELNNSYAKKKFKRHVNPGLYYLYKTAGFDQFIQNAHGAYLSLSQNSNKIIDCVSGAGSCSLGHNNAKIYNKLQQFIKNKNYNYELELYIKKLIGMPITLLAPSGASAVDVALIVALRKTGRKRIITFNSNYSGKTLLSLNVSRNKFIEVPFEQLYDFVSYIDPWSETSIKDLKKILEKEDTAIIWFEYIQGSSLRIIPEEFLNYIFSNKSKYGYYIGIDEILFGGYRTGKLTSIDTLNYQPDIITFSKSISGGFFPVALVVFSKAFQKYDPEIKFYRKYYKNNFAAYIALITLKELSTLFSNQFFNRFNIIRQKIHNCLTELAAFSNKINHIQSAGFVFQINYKYPKLMINFFGENVTEFALTLYYTKNILKKSYMLFFFDRIILPLNIKNSDMKKIQNGLKKFFRNNRINYITLLYYQIKISLYSKLCNLKSQINMFIYNFLNR